MSTIEEIGRPDIAAARKVLERIARNRDWYISIEYVGGLFHCWPNTITYRDAKERELMLKLWHGRVGGVVVGGLTVVLPPAQAMALEADAIDEMSADDEEPYEPKQRSFRPYAIASNANEGIDVCWDEEAGKVYLMRFPNGKALAQTSQYFDTEDEAKQTYQFGTVEWS